MMEEFETLKESYDQLAVDTTRQIGDLRAEMRTGFEEQKRLHEEQRRLLSEMAHRQDELATSHTRQAARFDSSMAGLEETYVQHRRSVGAIWSLAIRKVGDMTVSFEEIRVQNKEIIQRLDAVENRLAG